MSEPKAGHIRRASLNDEQETNIVKKESLMIKKSERVDPDSQKEAQEQKSKDPNFDFRVR